MQIKAIFLYIFILEYYIFNIPIMNFAILCTDSQPLSSSCPLLSPIYIFTIFLFINLFFF